MGWIVSVASSVYGFDQYFYFIDFMIHITDYMQFCGLYIGYSRDSLQMGRMVSVASSMYEFNLYFQFIDFIIHFTDFMIFLSLYRLGPCYLARTYKWTQPFNHHHP